MIKSQKYFCSFWHAICNNQNLILATIYCPNGNPDVKLFEPISNPSDNVMFVGDFSSKLEAFGCAKKKRLWSNAKKYSKSSEPNLNNDEHTLLD